MRNLILLFSVLSGAALLAASAHADDNPQTNVFNADMSNPDLAAVITSFQDVCLPFITHKTELPKNLNQEHRAKLLTEQGFEFQSREPQPARMLIEWKPASQAVNQGTSGTGPVNMNTSGTFTVYNGVSSQVVESTETIVSPIGAIGPAVITAKYKSITRHLDSYVPAKDSRQTATLEWNYASEKHPAKSCGIKIDKASISSETFETDFLSKDPDWRDVSRNGSEWSQCTIDDADEFEFTVENRDGVLSLSVRRNDFYEPKLCLNNSSAGF